MLTFLPEPEESRGPGGTPEGVRAQQRRCQPRAQPELGGEEAHDLGVVEVAVREGVARAGAAGHRVLAAVLEVELGLAR